MSDTRFEVEVLVISPKTGYVFDSERYPNQRVTEDLVRAVWSYMLRALGYAGFFSDGDAPPKFEINATNLRTGDAMGQGVRTEREVETYFQDSFFTE